MVFIAKCYQEMMQTPLPNKHVKAALPKSEWCDHNKPRAHPRGSHCDLSYVLEKMIHLEAVPIKRPRTHHSFLGSSSPVAPLRTPNSS